MCVCIIVPLLPLHSKDQPLRNPLQFFSRAPLKMIKGNPSERKCRGEVSVGLFLHFLENTDDINTFITWLIWKDKVPFVTVQDVDIHAGDTESNRRSEDEQMMEWFFSPGQRGRGILRCNQLCFSSFCPVLRSVSQHLCGGGYHSQYQDWRKTLCVHQWFQLSRAEQTVTEERYGHAAQAHTDDADF